MSILYEYSLIFQCGFQLITSFFFASLFDENLRIVDNGIKNITKLFHEIFNDDKTAFIFTSDHGMSSKGAHGAGTAYETETPIVAWGAGINYWKESNDAPNDVTSILNVDVSRFDIQQADVASLISALIGNAIPVNNVGRLPHIYLNASDVSLELKISFRATN